MIRHIHGMTPHPSAHAEQEKGDEETAEDMVFHGVILRGGGGVEKREDVAKGEGG